MSSRLAIENRDMHTTMIPSGRHAYEDDSLVAVVYTVPWVGWVIGRTEGTYWRFWKFGREVAWDELSDGDRMKVRTKNCWEHSVSYYWSDLRYLKKDYYTIELLLELV